MQVFLDDERAPPHGWIHVKTPEEAIELLKTNNVDMISLDHDLGLEPDTRNGYQVVLYIEEAADNGTLNPLEWNVHTANASVRQKMIQGLENATRSWQEWDDGTDLSEQE